MRLGNAQGKMKRDIRGNFNENCFDITVTLRLEFSTQGKRIIKSAGWESRRQMVRHEESSRVT